MLNGTYTVALYPEIIVAVSRLLHGLQGYNRLIRISKNVQTKEGSSANNSFLLLSFSGLKAG